MSGRTSALQKLLLLRSLMNPSRFRPQDHQLPLSCWTLQRDHERQTAVLQIGEAQFVRLCKGLPQLPADDVLLRGCYHALRSALLEGVGHGKKRHIFFPPHRSYQRSATNVEKPLSLSSKEEVSLPAAPTQQVEKRDGREEIKLALSKYLERTLQVPRQWAVHISQNSPAFVDGVVKNLAGLSSVSESGESSCGFPSSTVLDKVLKDLLGRSKVKGVEPLLESLGVDPHDIHRVGVYARSGVKGVLVKVDLLKIIGVEPEDVPRVLTKYPRFLSNALETHQLKVEYLSQLGMSPLEICKLVTSYPNSLSFALKEGNLPLVDFLKKAGVKDEEIKLVVTRCPQLLTLSIERKLKPAVETLATVGIKGDYLARVMVMQPSLLRRRLKKNIAFCRELGLDAKVIARLLVTCPNFSVDGCLARMAYLESTGLTKEQITFMIKKNAAFLSLNVHTALAPKVDYLLKEMGRPVQELVAGTTFLTVSLQNRIKPRHRVLAALEDAGLLDRTYSLTTMTTWSNDEFYTRFVEPGPAEAKRLWREFQSVFSVPRKGGSDLALQIPP